MGSGSIHSCGWFVFTCQNVLQSSCTCCLCPNSCFSPALGRFNALDGTRDLCSSIPGHFRGIGASSGGPRTAPTSRCPRGAQKVTLLCHLQRSWPKQPTSPGTRLGLDETGFLGGALCPHPVPQPSPSLLVRTAAPDCSPTSLHPSMHPIKLLLLCAQALQRRQRWHSLPLGSTVPLGHSLPGELPFSLGAKLPTLAVHSIVSSKIDDKKNPGLHKLTAKRTPRELVCLGVSRKDLKAKGWADWAGHRALEEISGRVKAKAGDTEGVSGEQ